MELDDTPNNKCVPMELLVVDVTPTVMQVDVTSEAIVSVVARKA